MSLPSTQYPWFALSVKHHHEKAVARALDGRGIAQYLPVYPSGNRAGGHVPPVFLPLFPGYVFASFDAMRRLPVLTIPAVGSIVTFNRIPAPIPSDELERVDTLLRSELPTEPWPFLHDGDLVYIARGPLRGLEGRLIAYKGHYRLIVSISILQRSVSTEIERHWVRPCSQPVSFSLVPAS